MRLVIVHYHLRPGGVRRVIELALPDLVRALRPRVSEVVFAVGEAADQRWLDALRATLAPLPVAVRVHPCLGYWAEISRQAKASRQLRAFFDMLLEGNGTGSVVWAHNQSLGRNLPASEALVRACARHRQRLVLHHHDWWFDNRWHRWPEMRVAGFRTLARVAATIFPKETGVRHIAINGADAAQLRRYYANRSDWLPNPVNSASLPVEACVRAARAWLGSQLGERAPVVWLLPCRLLRRKNIAEALLLARWLRPEAWLVTTAGVSSSDEQAYASRLASAAQQYGWRLQLSILHGERTGSPTVAELMGASEALLLTSLVEGFGLPYLEAAAARRPLLARTLPNVAPDLERFGFRFPQAYREILIDPALFDWAAERTRQKEQFHRWRAQLPRSCRAWAELPVLLAEERASRAIPFSRLTITAQMEVLARPASESWAVCAPLNPFLSTWRRRAASGRLEITAWPKSAERWLGGRANARRFADTLASEPGNGLQPGAAIALQRDFIRAKLAAANQYPLLWDSAL